MSIVQKALDDLYNRNIEEVIDLLTQELMKKLSQEYDLSIPEQLEKAKVVMDEQITEYFRA